jgi:HEAT repeat protein
LRLLPAAALCLVLGACGSDPGPPDPAPLVADLLSGDPQKSGAARLELITMGGPAAPALAAVLREGDSAERSLAATTLWGMGARGQAAVPDLAAALGGTDLELRIACAMALENMGPSAREAVPALTKALRDRERRVRQAAVKALGAIGPDASSALPALEREIKRESWPEAEEAVRRIRSKEIP